MKVYASFFAVVLFVFLVISKSYAEMDSNNAMGLMNTETEMQQEGIPGQNMRVKRVKRYWQIRYNNNRFRHNNNRFRYNNNRCVRNCGYRNGRHYCNNCYRRQNYNGYEQLLCTERKKRAQNYKFSSCGSRENFN